MTDGVKVIEEFTPKKISLRSKEDFQKYLDIHKNDVKDVSIYKLNKMFSIPNYRVTKIKGEIALTVHRYISLESRLNKISDIKQSVKMEDMKLLDDKINYIIEILKENNLIGEE
ncbi:hypothetical protein FACS189472_18990 [Alphaproteobacteria bacterium]|nr:hypothetical protein FACS189472_18990 [Alphaproteobacteria bacterium]